jgi:hypothetical protein
LDVDRRGDDTGQRGQQEAAAVHAGWWGDSMRDVKYGRCPALRREVGHWKQAVRRQSATKDRRDSDLVILCATAKSAARRSAE